jgi:Na+-driven multidrug efflux pump
MFLTMAAVFGFGMATTVRVGQHFGARDIPPPAPPSAPASASA